jgi:hypothetical protein
MKERPHAKGGSARSTERGRQWIAALAALLLGLASVGQAAEPAAAEEEAAAAPPEASVEDLTLEIPQSVFIDRQGPGIRDPFFPESSRSWGERQASTDPVLPIKEKIEKLVLLKGITGQVGDKVALLNNQTFKVGDTVRLRLSDGTYLRLTMVKILETSVEFTVEGQEGTFTKQLED